MNPLCTFLLPSRRRPARLVESIASIESTTGRDAYRIHVRTESDDIETQRVAAQLLREGRIDLTLDQPPRGYAYIHDAWAALLPVVTPWMWVWSDDTLLHGNWVAALAPQPLIGVICHAETITNNRSVYRHVSGGPFPVVPGNTLEVLGLTSFPAPIDVGLDQDLRAKGWATRFLSGVTVEHNRLEHLLATERTLLTPQSA